MILVPAALGLGLGAGMPLGVINVAIADAALAGQRRFATGLGLGGAIADTAHAALAFAGIGRIVAAHPTWTRALSATAAIVLIGYAIAAWRAHHGTREVPASTASRGAITGIALTLPNPAALGAWVAVAAAIWPMASTSDAIALGLGVGVGSAAWFTLLARWMAALRLDHPARRYVPRIALVVLVAIALVGVARTL